MTINRRSVRPNPPVSPPDAPAPIPPYSSGAGSLFSIIARGESSTEAPPPNSGNVVITCPWCLSDDTEMIDHDMQIYRCRRCGETFGRPSG